MVFGIDKNALTGGFMTTIVIGAIRGALNGALKNTTPKELVEAIKNDTSLWGDAGSEINGYAKTLPISDLSVIADVRKIVDAQYGGFTTIVLKWLGEDHPIYYNIVVNTPGGKGVAWIDKQISDILDGVQNGDKNGK